MADNKIAHGTFCWNELMTRDTDAAAKFYTELLGWEAVDSGMTDTAYTIMKADGKDAGGMMMMPPDIPEQVPAHWMAYIAVDDVDSLVEKTKQLGGKVHCGPMDIPQIGRFCVIEDPTGAAVSLIKLAQ